MNDVNVHVCVRVRVRACARACVCVCTRAYSFMPTWADAHALYICADLGDVHIYALQKLRTVWVGVLYGWGAVTSRHVLYMCCAGQMLCRSFNTSMHSHQHAGSTGQWLFYNLVCRLV